MTRITYQWKPKYPSRGVDATAAGRAIENIIAAHSGQITPRHVLLEAKKPGSPLHNLITWDDRKAADHYRIMEAGAVLRALVTVRMDDGEPEAIRAFVAVSDPQDASNRTVFMIAEEAMADDACAARVLDEALRQLEGWKSRYHAYQKLRNACCHVEEAIASIRGAVKS